MARRSSLTFHPARCPICGELIQGNERGSEQIYCPGGKCRQKAYRQRVKARREAYRASVGKNAPRGS